MSRPAAVCRPMSSPPLPYLLGYPEAVRTQAAQALATGRLGPWLQQRYPDTHGLRSDTALYDYVAALRNRFLRTAPPLAKVRYDGTLQTVHQALGTHTRVTRVHGGRLRTKREIRIATLFRVAPEPFLHMIAAHELAHLREPEHNKAFYQLCCHMAPDYAQLELDVRLYLTHLDAAGAPLWTP